MKKQERFVGQINPGPRFGGLRPGHPRRRHRSPHRQRFVAAVVITALSIGFDATPPLMSSITTSADPKHIGQITANFLGMGAGALCFQHLIALGFNIALAVFCLNTDFIRPCSPLRL
jgi:hypothetical protein